MTMCRHCVVHKGRAVGKSTELGATTFDLEVQGHIIAKVNSLKACEPVKGPVHELDLEELKSAIVAGLQIPREYLEPTLTAHASTLLEMDKQLAAGAKSDREFLDQVLRKMSKP
jgi:hypothetical protein